MSHIKAICPQARGQTGLEPPGGSGDWVTILRLISGLADLQLEADGTLSQLLKQFWRTPWPCREYCVGPGRIPLLTLGAWLYSPQALLSRGLVLPCIIFEYRTVPDLSLLVLWWPNCALHISGLVDLELEEHENRGLKWKRIRLSSHLGQLMARSSWKFAIGSLKSSVWN